MHLGQGCNLSINMYDYSNIIMTSCVWHVSVRLFVCVYIGCVRLQRPGAVKASLHYHHMFA